MNQNPLQVLTATWWSMALMVFTMLTAMASRKIIGIDHLSLNAAWLLAPAFLIIPAVLTWRYGARYATTIVHSNAIALVLAMLAIKIAIAVPADASWNGQASYVTVLTFSWSAIITLSAAIWLSSWLVVLLTRLVHQGQTTEPSLQGLFPIVAMLFVMSLLVSNITTQKIAHFFGDHVFAVTVDVGTLFFPLTYIFNNIFTEVYGYKRSRILIWGGLLGNLLMTLLLQVWVWLPGASDWHQQAAYADIVGTVPRIVLASTVAFFGGEFVNSLCLAKLKILTSGRYLWTRTIGSTVVGVAVDSLAFSAIAFIGVVPLMLVLSIAAWEYAMKVGYEVLATPLTVTVIAWFKRREHCDRYDYQTRFNPFRFTDIHYQQPQQTR